MLKYVHNLFEYWQYKIIAGLIASIFSDNFFKLLTILILLNVLDIFSRFLSNSYNCYKSIYPNSPCGLWKAFTFLWQARKWRFIRSTGLRDGFCDKMMLYLILLLVGAFVDTAYALGNTPRIMSSIIVMVLASTEALSILENLSECNEIIKQIKDKFKHKLVN